MSRYLLIIATLAGCTTDYTKPFRVVAEVRDCAVVNRMLHLDEQARQLTWAALVAKATAVCRTNNLLVGESIYDSAVCEVFGSDSALDKYCSPETRLRNIRCEAYYTCI